MLVDNRRVTCDGRPAVGQLFETFGVWRSNEEQEGELWEVRAILGHCHVRHMGVGCLWLVDMVSCDTGEVVVFEVEQLPTSEYLGWKDENGDRLSKPSWWDSVIW